MWKIVRKSVLIQRILIGLEAILKTILSITKSLGNYKWENSAMKYLRGNVLINFRLVEYLATPAYDSHRLNIHICGIWSLACNSLNKNNYVSYATPTYNTHTILTGENLYQVNLVCKYGSHLLVSLFIQYEGRDGVKRKDDATSK